MQREYLEHQWLILITPQERDAYVRDMESNTWCNPELVGQLKNKPLHTVKRGVLTDEHYQAIPIFIKPVE